MPLSRSFPALVFALLPVLAAAQGQGGGAPPVEVAKPVTDTVIDHHIFTGRFEPVQEVDISARVSGYLDEIHFKDGQLVERGDLLFTIDQRTFSAAVERAEAQRAATDAARNLAALERDRAVQLADRRVGSTQDADQARAAYLEAEAQVKVAEAELRQAQLDLDFTEIVAPITGRISDSYVDTGNLVIGGNTGATVLTAIVSIDPIQFTFTASERDFLSYARLVDFGSRGSATELGSNVGIKLMDEAEFLHRGEIDFVNNRLDPNSGTITGRAIVANPDHFLTPGLFGRIRLPSSRPYEAVLVPDAAVVSDQARKLVYVVDAEGKVGIKPVTLGPLHRGLRVIRDGLTAEDTVIVNGLLRARPGATVSPQTVELTLAEE